MHLVLKKKDLITGSEDKDPKELSRSDFKISGLVFEEADIVTFKYFEEDGYKYRDLKNRHWPMKTFKEEHPEL